MSTQLVRTQIVYSLTLYLSIYLTIISFIWFGVSIVVGFPNLWFYFLLGVASYTISLWVIDIEGDKYGQVY